MCPALVVLAPAAVSFLPAFFEPGGSPEEVQASKHGRCAQVSAQIGFGITVQPGEDAASIQECFKMRWTFLVHFVPFCFCTGSKMQDSMNNRFMDRHGCPYSLMQDLLTGADGVDRECNPGASGCCSNSWSGREHIGSLLRTWTFRCFTFNLRLSRFIPNRCVLLTWNNGYLSLIEVTSVQASVAASLTTTTVAVATTTAAGQNLHASLLVLVASRSCFFWKQPGEDFGASTRRHARHYLFRLFCRGDNPHNPFGCSSLVASPTCSNGMKIYENMFCSSR